MGVVKAVQWWGDWQLRVLVLGSLFLQYFLFATAAFRKRHMPPWLRFSIWLAYIGSDAVAIYALATLFNHQKKREWVPSAARNNASLEALWAPVLLLHLGGQDGMAAFAIEDNELWKRHVLTALSQITVAVYVFYKSWTQDIRLFQATILIFVPGILKCLEKPWALNRASIYSIAKTTGSEVKDSSAEHFNTANMGSNNYYSLNGYVIQAKKYFKNDHKAGDNNLVLESPYRLFVDLSYSFEVRLHNLRYMAKQRDNLREVLYSRLFKTFDRFYTKRYVYRDTFLGPVVRTLAVVLTFSAIGLFHTCRTEAYSYADVNITYFLLCCTATLEFISAFLKPCRHSRFLKKTRLPRPHQVAQYNLIWYLACRNKKQRRLLRWLSGLVHCKGRLDRLRCMESCEDNGITELIHDHVMKGWKTNIITNAYTYMKFNDNRGQLTLERHKALLRNIRRPFDESVLVWHLATDFCFYMEDAEEESTSPCRRMSNYMAYLLFVRPEMLIPGARDSLFMAAYHELRHGIMSNEDTQGEGEEELGRRIVRQMERMTACTKDGTHFVHDAWALAQELMSIRKKNGAKAMWELIKGVWVEMLCFSAGRSRGYLHAKSLGRGGEYLSCVWLLLWYMGMETFAMRLRRNIGLPEEGDMSAAVPEETPDNADTKPAPDEEPASLTAPTDAVAHGTDELVIKLGV
ncbi:unnamed protein product [Urochloa decumbens]|uniref:DUF4220 domain-containing protein n=1 Tax=Urochloa decumbens TaxID=240449 RepID=A0ABC9H7I3_9POAL